MTITNQTNRARFTGNAVTTAFDFTFKALASADLVVSLVVAGVETVQTITTHYTVSLLTEGGTVTFVTAPANGTIVVIERSMAYTQPTDYANQGSFYPATHENSYDRATMQVQQIKDQIGRSPQVPPWTATTFTTELPTVAANRFVVINSDATGFTLSDVSPLADPTMRQDLAASSGSSLVGFINSGTGAAARTLQVRGRDVIYAKDFGAVGDGVTNDTAALQAAITAAAGKKLIITAGTYLTTALTNASAIAIEGDGFGKTILKAFVATGSLDLFSSTVGNVSISQLTIDLNNTANTIAAGYVANRNGIYFLGAVGTYIANVFLDVQVKNCGEAGIKLKYVDRATIYRPDIDRCGQYGIYCLSCSNVWVDSPDVYDIFPGSGGAAPYLNAYGITFTYSGSDPAPFDCTVVNGMIENVTSWTAYDTHGGLRIRFINCSTKNCSEGVSIQSTATGYESADILIMGGTHDGYGNVTRDSTSFDTAGGVTANMGNATTRGKNLIVSDVTVRDMGGKQTGSSAAAFKIEACDTYKVNGCSAINAYQWAFRTNGICLDGQMLGNSIKGVIEANSIKTGFSWSNTTFCVVDDNTIAGLPASSVPWSISAPASSTYGIKFGAGNVMEQGGIDHWSDTGYRNMLAGSGFLGVAKAWLSYNGSTDTIVDRYGITGVVKNSTGTYTVTLANTISTTDSVVLATGNRFVRKASGASTSSFQILCESPVGTLADDEELSVVVFGILQRK